MFIVFVTHSTDRDCVSHPTTTQYMSKMVIFQLEKSIDFWDYVIGILAVLVVFTVIYVIAGCFLLWSNRYIQHNDVPPSVGTVEPHLSGFPVSRLCGLILGKEKINSSFLCQEMMNLFEASIRRYSLHGTNMWCSFATYRNHCCSNGERWWFLPI